MDDQSSVQDVDKDIYTEAAVILAKAADKRATLKTLIYSSQCKNIRKLFALVNECMKYKDVVEEVLSHCPVTLKKDDPIGGNHQMAVVLLYEYLLGHKFGKAVSLRKLFQSYKLQIKTAVDKVLLSHNVKTLQEAVQNLQQDTTIKIPRYMRVNLIKLSVDSAINILKSEGWDYVDQMDSSRFSDSVMALHESQFGLDPFLPDLLVFPPGTDLHDHHLTTSGELVQQDRASCIPAHVLNPPPGSVVVDCCAAPGNKTSHLASLLRDEGRVIALDRDYKRMLTMSHLLNRSGATCVEMIHQDFLTVKPGSDDAQDIEFILVDPSCSGSGMLGSHTEHASQNSSSQRLQTLKRFQISILKHALRFPNVKRVVYSTCSIHQEENEEVAEEVMSQVSDYFQFHTVFPEWKSSRGLDKFPHSKCFLRLSPQQDMTQGFFVACFERIKHKSPKTASKEGNVSPKPNAKHKGEEIKQDSSILDIYTEETDVTQLSLSVENPEHTKSHDMKKQKKKKRKQNLISETEITPQEAVHHQIVSEKRKKMKNPKANKDLSMNGKETDSVSMQSEDLDIQGGRVADEHAETMLGKAKKRKQVHDISLCEDTSVAPPKRKKKRKNEMCSETMVSAEDYTAGLSLNTEKQQKKNKKHKTTNKTEAAEFLGTQLCSGSSGEMKETKKKKKKKKQKIEDSL